VIVSTADAEDNRISTESLTAKQINNTTEYSVESMSISVGNIGGNSLSGGAASDSDSQSNTTYSALSEGTIDIRNGDTSALATIKGSEAEAHTVLENNFNQDLIIDVQDQLEAQQMAGELVGAAVNDYAKSQLKEANTLETQAKEAKDAGNEIEANSLQAQADEIKADWGKDSRQRNIVTAVISGALGGNLNQTLASATSQELFREVGDLYQDLENAEAWLKEAQDNPSEYSSDEIELRQEKLDKAREEILIPKELAHAIAGGISASLTGGNVAEGALAAGVNEFINQELNDLTPTDSSTRNLLATVVGGAIGGSDGAIITNTADTFNRQLHPTEVKFVDEQVEAYASDKNISPEEARKLLLRGAVYDSDFDWQEVYEDYTPEQVAAYKEANDYLASVAKNEGLTFTNELGQQQLAFTSTDDQRSNSKLFLSTFTDDSVKETYTEYAKPEQGILDSIAGGFGTAAGNSIGGATGAFQGTVVDTVDSVVTALDPETYAKLSQGGKAAYDLYQEDPEKFKDIVKGLPEDVKAAIENEINAFYNEGFLLETQRKDYAAAEHLTSGETRQAIGVVNPFRKLKILEIVANATDKFTIKSKVPEGNVVRVNTTNSTTKGTPDYDALNSSTPNTRYELDNGTTFNTNSGGRVEEVTFTPVDTKIPRDSRQTQVGKEGLPSDVGGHIQACSMGGTCDRFNLFPQDKNFNNSGYKKFENEIRDALKNGDDVGAVTVKFRRSDPNAARPDALRVEYTINGETKTRRFINEHGGGQ
jgi:hypothetical protein